MIIIYLGSTLEKPYCKPIPRNLRNKNLKQESHGQDYCGRSCNWSTGALSSKASEKSLMDFREALLLARLFSFQDGVSAV
jgi:hypothetical protein